MARLHHVSRDLVSRAGRGPEPGPVPSWRPSRPQTGAGVEPWFLLTPEAPSADSRVGPGTGPGVVATLATFGGITGPAITTFEDPEERLPVVLGGSTVPPGTPPPDHPSAFRRQCAIVVSLRAAELGRGRQCLLVVAVRAEVPSLRASVQSFAGVVPIAEDRVDGEDRLAFVIDADDAGGLAIDLCLRLCAEAGDARLGVRGVVGYLL